jgi:hypothetical protein
MSLAGPDEIVEYEAEQQRGNVVVDLLAFVTPDSPERSATGLSDAPAYLGDDPAGLSERGPQGRLAQ